MLSALQKSVQDFETAAIANILAGRVTSLQEPSTDLQKDHLRLLEIRSAQRILSQLLSIQNNIDLVQQAAFGNSVIRTLSDRQAPATSTGTSQPPAAAPRSGWCDVESEVTERVRSFTDSLKSCASELQSVYSLLPRRALGGLSAHYKGDPQQLPAVLSVSIYYSFSSSIYLNLL